MQETIKVSGLTDNETEEVTEEVIGVESDPAIEELIDLLSEEDHPPSKLDLEEWKDIHGKFYVSTITGDDMYIWRTLKRKDYKSIIESGAMTKQDTYENAVMRKCLLWPIAEAYWINSLDAGIIPTLFTQVMHKSGFIPEDVALQGIKRI